MISARRPGRRGRAARAVGDVASHLRGGARLPGFDSRRATSASPQPVDHLGLEAVGGRAEGARFLRMVIHASPAWNPSRISFSHSARGRHVRARPFGVVIGDIERILARTSRSARVPPSGKTPFKTRNKMQNFHPSLRGGLGMTARIFAGGETGMGKYAGPAGGCAGWAPLWMSPSAAARPRSAGHGGARGWTGVTRSGLSAGDARRRRPGVAFWEG